MYGYFLRCIAELVEKRHGREAWLKICDVSGISVVAGNILVHRKYCDKDTMALIHTTAAVLDVTIETLLEETGVYFLDYLKTTGYERFIRALGNTLYDLLTNLDLVYHHLDPFYPDMSAPSFRCAPANEGGLLLQYRSHRRGFGPFVVGLIKAIAQDIFALDVQMEQVTPESYTADETQKGSVEAYVIKDKKALSLGNRKRSTSFISNFSRHRISSNPKDLSISQGTLCCAFPFHFIVDRELSIVQMGDTLTKLLSLQVSSTFSALKLSDIFVIQKPIVAMTFSSILSNMNTLFNLKFKLNHTCKEGQPFLMLSDDNMCLRGQVVYMPESDSILFMCSPRVQEISHLDNMHLTLVDIPSHDVTRDLFLVSQCRRQGRELVRKLEETSCDLLKMQEKLQQERKQTDKLLFSMLPEHIAHELRLHRKIKAERFDVVTVLCSDIVNFTALCGHENVGPMDIIRVLNKLYTQFDALTSIHGVFKVETIGDAYLIVGGVPEYSCDHADKVISMAFDMTDVCKTVISPADGKQIQIRLGVHSGECVAGVVGQKKPRYCLFGHTVSLASQMEALSLPSRINITENTKRCLLMNNNLEYEPNKKGTPCDAFLISRKKEVDTRSIALGLPPPRGMFKTPNPTPPSSRDSSPASSPSWVDRFPPMGIHLKSFSTTSSSLTVPFLNLPKPPVNETTFSFDFNSVTVDLPSCSSNIASPCSKSREDSSLYERNNNVCEALHVPSTCENNTSIEPVEDIEGPAMDCMDDTMKKVRPKKLNASESLPTSKPGTSISSVGKKNGLLRRYSDIPKTVFPSDDRLILYFRPSQSMPPTPNTS